MLGNHCAEMFKLCLHRNPLLLRRFFPLLIAWTLGLKGYADIHVSTNGTHTGVLFRSGSPGATSALDSHDVPGGHDFIGSLTLAYGLWTMGGEPVHEFILTWEWHTPTLTLGRRGQHMITTAELRKYPDLTNSFYALKPLSMLLETKVQFYDAAGNRLASAEKVVNPGLLERAQAKPRFHAPGSPRWADFFRTRQAETLAGDELDRRHKELFLKAARVELTEPQIKSVTWPEAALSQIVDEFCRREGLDSEPKVISLGSHSPTTVVATNATPAVTSGPAAGSKPMQTRLNPLEQAANRITTTENPFERAARLETEKHSEKPSP